MLPRNHPDRIQITFDDRRLVANAGLLLPATLARHLGLPELVRQCLDLGDAPGRANTSDKMMSPRVLADVAHPHVRQLDRVSRELLARAWQAGAGPHHKAYQQRLGAIMLGNGFLCEHHGNLSPLAAEVVDHHGRRWPRPPAPPSRPRRPLIRSIQIANPVQH